MNGTASSEKRAMERRPPKMIRAVRITTAMPASQVGRPKAPCMAPVMVLACTELKTKPKVRIRNSENSTPIQRAPRPFSM
ncbi:hypothetical protein D9M71_725010 [compost metagenome]